MLNKKIVLFVFLLLFIYSNSKGQQFVNDIELPIRMTRSFGVSGNTGWNSLTGFGVTIQNYFTPKIALDAGVGLSTLGVKFGGRVRYLFLTKNFSPFVSVGYIYGMGSRSNELELEDTDGSIVRFVVEPSNFIQLSGGIEYVSNGGFFIMTGIGYSLLLNDNILLTSGNSPSEEMRSLLKILYGSGVAVEVSVGYIFGRKKGYNKF